MQIIKGRSIRADKEDSGNGGVGLDDDPNNHEIPRHVKRPDFAKAIRRRLKAHAKTTKR